MFYSAISSTKCQPSSQLIGTMFFEFNVDKTSLITLSLVFYLDDLMQTMALCWSLHMSVMYMPRCTLL